MISKIKEDNPIKEIKLTTIVGPPADKIINAMKRGETLTYKDDSVDGVPILDVYLEVDSAFWNLKGEKWEEKEDNN